MRPIDAIGRGDEQRPATSIFEAALWRYSIKVTCCCNKSVTFEPLGLWWRFRRKGWSDDFRDGVRHIYCQDCTEGLGRKIRPLRMETTSEPPRITYPLPDEREWCRAVHQHRG